MTKIGFTNGKKHGYLPGSESDASDSGDSGSISCFSTFGKTGGVLGRRIGVSLGNGPDDNNKEVEKAVITGYISHKNWLSGPTDKKLPIRW